MNEDHQPDDRPDEQRLRDLLRDSVDGLEPPDALPTIRRRLQEDAMTHPHSPGRRTTWLALAGAAAVAVVVAGVVLVTQDTDPTSSDPPPAATSAPSTPGTPEPTASPDGSPSTDDATPDSPATTRALPVYYVGDTPVGPRLYREFHRVTATDDDALLRALQEAVGTAPLDPDYRTPWPSGTQVDEAVAQSSEQAVAIDLSGVAPGSLRSRPAGMSRAEARMAVEQLIHTAQAVLQERAPVRFLLDGSITDQVLGVPTSEPLANGDAMSVQASVWITSPQDGDSVDGGTIRVVGRGAFFEATVSWQLLRGGAVVKEGFATATECCTLAPYEFTIGDVAPGDYVLRVYDADMSGGESGRAEAEDTKRVTVR